MIEQAKITFQSDGSPYSSQFGDIYFDTTEGTSQSENVFIDGNNIRMRLAKSQEKFVIAETGFGTGLNFLLTLQIFNQIRQDKSEQSTAPVSTLHFISLEKYPLSRAQLEQSLEILPQLAPFSQ